MLNLSPFLAIPYVHRGRSTEGCDCLGFVILFYFEALGRILPDVEEMYSVRWEAEQKNPYLDYHKYFTRMNTPELYDLVAFKNKRGVVNHSGVVLGNGRFIHCCKDGVMVDSYLRPEWQTKLNGFYRLNP